MYVPNYIPEPLEVPGNITLRPYARRVQFIRRVTWIHVGSLGIATGVAFLSHPAFSPAMVVGVLAALLVVLDLLRIQLRGQAKEADLSSSLLPVVLVLFGWLAKDMNSSGWPTWSILLGEGAILFYTMVCGRDYSFVGCYFLSLIVSSVGIAGITVFLHLPAHLAGRALFLNFAYLSYTVYDLASLLARRREGEELASVTDLYRDVFNFFGYFQRCLQHWRKHRIWIAPK